MMKLEIKKIMLIATCTAAIVWGHTASAACALGYTCFGDDATSAEGRVQYNNDNWGNFGWNNRADSFTNNGRYSNNCIYDGYDQKGSRFLLRRGDILLTINASGTGYTSDPYWRNRVSSNKWTNATSVSNCPNQ